MHKNDSLKKVLIMFLPTFREVFFTDGRSHVISRWTTKLEDHVLSSLTLLV